jgi:anti-anti-sigma regulatory factor
MRAAGGDQLPGSGHEVLLAASPDHRSRLINAWVRAAATRNDRVLTLAAPSDTALGPVPSGSAHVPAELGRRGVVEMVRSGRDDGVPGHSIIVWADRLIAATSNAVHADVEAALIDLCRDHPVSALCLYDRAGIGTEQIEAAVARHPDGLREQHLHLRCDGHTLHFRGEIDMTNIDVLRAALPGVRQTRARTMRIDLGRAQFLSAAAVAALARDTDAFRSGGGLIELQDATPHVMNILRLLQIDALPGVYLT